MKIQNKKKSRGGWWEEVDFFPFPFRRPPRAFFSPHPILPSTMTQRGGSNRTLGAKDFSSAISVRPFPIALVNPKKSAGKSGWKVLKKCSKSQNSVQKVLKVVKSYL